MEVTYAAMTKGLGVVAVCDLSRLSAHVDHWPSKTRGPLRHLMMTGWRFELGAMALRWLLPGFRVSRKRLNFGVGLSRHVGAHIGCAFKELVACGAITGEL